MKTLKLFRGAWSASGSFSRRNGNFQSRNCSAPLNIMSECGTKNTFDIVGVVLEVEEMWK